MEDNQTLTKINGCGLYAYKLDIQKLKKTCHMAPIKELRRSENRL